MYEYIQYIQGFFHSKLGTADYACMCPPLRAVGIVRSRTQTMEFVLFLFFMCPPLKTLLLVCSLPQKRIYRCLATAISRDSFIPAFVRLVSLN
jgi:hypothetical protein